MGELKNLHMDKDRRMAQFSVIVPDDLGELINEISKQTGRSISSLCADYLQEGAYRHVEQLNKVEVWRSQLTERQKTKEKTQQET
jgi:hypothetical protein